MNPPAIGSEPPRGLVSPSADLLADLAALRLEPTDDDIADIQADGYLGEVLAELRAGQDEPDGEVARDALALLAGLLDERRAGAAR